ncbi:MAG: hypothetical protein LBE83_09225 [Propionibacteriaceae bacterium]|jgi:type II secretory pathway component PulF|nr:hypothetical protein [Propionibacteriaceae bacterium]
MKKFLCVLLTLLGLGAVLYFLTQRNAQARQLWNDTLAKVPGLCNCCCEDEEEEEI